MGVALGSAFVLGACDAPHPSSLTRALALRAEQTFHALPPEAPVVATRPPSAPRRPAATAVAPAVDDAAPAPLDTVAGVGPPAVLVAAADSLLLAPGDSSPLSALALDAAGHAAPLATVRWRSLSPRVAEVGPWGVRALRAGRATLLADGDGLTASVAVDVRPVVRGRVLDVEGAPVAGARVRVQAGALRRELAADASGRFALYEPIAEDAEVRVELAPPPGAPLHGAALRVFADDADQLGVVLLPTSWRIRGGRFDGVVVAVRPAAALQRGGAFARLSDSPSEPGARVVGWPAPRLPLLLAPAASLAAADTAAFWATARAMEQDLGMRLFAPAGDDAGGARLVDVRVGSTIGADAVTHASWSGEGNLDDAEILVRAPAVLRDRAVIAHELLHLLGFGHCTAWPSVVAPTGGSSPGWLTAHDVAWTQLLYRLREVQSRERAPFGLGAAAGREEGVSSRP